MITSFALNIFSTNHKRRHHKWQKISQKLSNQDALSSRFDIIGNFFVLTNLRKTALLSCFSEMATNFTWLETLAENQLENRIQIVKFYTWWHGKRLDTSLEGAYIGTVFGRLSLVNRPVHWQHRQFLPKPTNFVPKLLYPGWKSGDYLFIETLSQIAPSGALSNQSHCYRVCICLIFCNWLYFKRVFIN